MEIINEKYTYIEDATIAIALINNKINLSLLLEDLNKSHKNNKKRIMLKKISSNIACIIEYIQDITEEYKQIYTQEYILRENMFYNFILKKKFISFVENTNINHDISNFVYSFLNLKNIYEF